MFQHHLKESNTILIYIHLHIFILSSCKLVNYHILLITDWIRTFKKHVFGGTFYPSRSTGRPHSNQGARKPKTYWLRLLGLETSRYCSEHLCVGSNTCQSKILAPTSGFQESIADPWAPEKFPIILGVTLVELF